MHGVLISSKAMPQAIYNSRVVVVVCIIIEAYDVWIIMTMIVTSKLVYLLIC